MITWSILNADVWTHDGKTDVIRLIVISDENASIASYMTAVGAQ